MKTLARLKWQSVLIAFLSITGQARNLLTNGDFEVPGFEVPKYYRYMANGDTVTIAGWTVIDDGIGEKPFLAHSGTSYYDSWIRHNGTYGVALNQGSGLSTSFAVVSNSLYEISFWLRPGFAFLVNLIPDPLVVRVAGYSTNIPPSNGWQLHTFQFTAYTNDSAAKLQFFNPSPEGDYRVYGIDDVEIVRVGAVISSPQILTSLTAVEVGVPTLHGQNYQIEGSNDFQAWFTDGLPSIQGTGDTTYFFLSTRTNHYRFFRARTVP